MEVLEDQSTDDEKNEWLRETERNEDEMRRARETVANKWQTKW